MNSRTPCRTAHARLLVSALALIVSGCGGGGGGNDAQTAGSAATPAAVAPVPAPVVAAEPAPAPIPPLSANPLQLTFGGTIGAPGYWPDGDTATGGDGKNSIDGIDCSSSEAYHIHAHLSIVRDGQALAIPALIGIPAGCTYEMHTHDKTGELHLEAPRAKRFTLGNLFAVWGQPLTRTNIAGITGLPVTIYVTDGTTTVEYKGEPNDLELTSHRLVTIQIGKPIQSIPTFIWDTPS